MQSDEENQQEIQDDIIPSLKDIISSKIEINTNQDSYRKSSEIEIYEPKEQKEIIYNTSIKKIGNEIGNTLIEEESIQEEDESNFNSNQKEKKSIKTKEEPESTTKIVKRVFQSEQPTTQTTYYEKRITTKTTTTNGRDSLKILNNNSTYSKIETYNKEKPLLIRSQRVASNTYTHPSPATRRTIENKTYLRNYNDSFRTHSTNRTENSIYNKYLSSSNKYNNYSKNNKISPRYQPSKKLITSQSFIGNRYHLKRPETSNRNRHRKSPDENEIKRKTIIRGNQVKNIQITHIIKSTKPSDFHITENLNTQTLQANPIEISKVDRAKLKTTGKSSWTSSCQDNFKPIVKNLKGKTTVYQHARGIGMTNEKKENLNPMFYTSEIRKLEPIVKEKEKEKVEYMTFRNEGIENISKYANTSRKNYNYNHGNNNSQQKKSYGNYNFKYNTLDNRVNKTNLTRNVGNYNGGKYSTSRNNKDIIKEKKAKNLSLNRSKYGNTGNSTSYMSRERMIYNSNSFFK